MPSFSIAFSTTRIEAARLPYITDCREGGRGEEGGERGRGGGGGGGRGGDKNKQNQICLKMLEMDIKIHTNDTQTPTSYYIMLAGISHSKATYRKRHIKELNEIMSVGVQALYLVTA